METLKGKVKKITKRFDNGWTSFTLTNNTRCIGKVFGLMIEGCTVEMEGEYINHPTFGKQFEIKSSKIIEEKNTNGIKKFLITYITGVGETLADKIIDIFGEKTLDVIKDNYDELTQIKGISSEKAQKIHNSYMLSRAYIDIIEFFNGDITENQAAKIYHQYKENSIKVLKENPYQLIYDIDGLGFVKVDKLAIASGIGINSPKRIEAAIIYTLKTLSQDGDVFVDTEEIEGKVKYILGKEHIDMTITNNILADNIMNLVNDNKLVVDVLDTNKVVIYLKYLYNAEVKCADIISKLLKSKPKAINYNSKIEEYERTRNIEFDDIQKDAIKMALNNNFSVITGGPGMGKTTILDCIITYSKQEVYLLAPTGKAAKRMKESTGHDSYTVDSLIIRYEAGTLGIKNKRFLVDESSMIDILKFSKLLNIVADTNSIVTFIGDVDQLPSIGPGNVLRDLIRCSLVPTVRLQFSYRFGGTIAKNAKLINEGFNYSDLIFDNSSSFFIKAPKEIIRASVEKIFSNLLNEFDISEIMVLAPMKNKSQSATCILNNTLRDIHNRNSRKFTDNNFDFVVGDRVMNIVNDRVIEGENQEVGVFNGDMGTIIDVDYINKTVMIKFDDDRIFKFNRKNISNLVPAYAMTYHKSQGSEAKAVICILNNEHSYMINRNLLYTGVTRAKEKLYIVGDTYAINTAIKNTKPITRNTHLSTRIEKAS